MISFFLNRQPLSFGNRNTTQQTKYYDDIQGAFEAYYSSPTRLYGDLYGSVYYFHKDPTGLDADNLSKPIWDALTGRLYDDDQMLKIRCAATFHLATGSSIALLDLTGMPKDRFQEFIKALDTENHIVYIEAGKINYSLYRFGSEVP